MDIFEIPDLYLPFGKPNTERLNHHWRYLFIGAFLYGSNLVGLADPANMNPDGRLKHNLRPQNLILPVADFRDAFYPILRCSSDIHPWNASKLVQSCG